MGAKALKLRRKGAEGEFAEVFAALSQILRRHTKGTGLTASIDCSTALIYTGPMMERWNRELWFGGAKIGRAYVSYHLMAVYMFPDLLRGLSPALKARMQGKSCFNFTQLDSALLASLEALTVASVQRLQREKLL